MTLAEIVETIKTLAAETEQASDYQSGKAQFMSSVLREKVKAQLSILEQQLEALSGFDREAVEWAIRELSERLSCSNIANACHLVQSL